MTTNLMPVTSERGHVVHVLDMREHLRWVPGVKATAICGREANWYMATTFIDDDKVCGRCDVQAPVAAVLFSWEIKLIETGDMLLPIPRERSLPDATDHEEEYVCTCGEAEHDHLIPTNHIAYMRTADLMRWISYGMSRGYIGEPGCGTDHDHEGNEADCYFLLPFFP